MRQWNLNRLLRNLPFGVHNYEATRPEAGCESFVAKFRSLRQPLPRFGHSPPSHEHTPLPRIAPHRLRRITITDLHGLEKRVGGGWPRFCRRSPPRQRRKGLRTAFDGGANGVGHALFPLPQRHGFTSLRDFAVATGSRPAAGLIEGSNGLLYGNYLGWRDSREHQRGHLLRQTERHRFTRCCGNSLQPVLKVRTAKGARARQRRQALRNHQSRRPAGGGVIFRVNADGSSFITLRSWPTKSPTDQIRSRA